MNKICTSQEQSQKLIELGIDRNTADMYYDVNSYGIQSKPEVAVGKVWSKDIPAWSLTALLELIPFQIIENNNRFGFYQDKGFNKQGETYHFCYKTNNDFCLYETSWYNDVIDAAFEMVCWLKENGKI